VNGGYLRGELLPWSLTTGGFASGLLGTSHGIGERKLEERESLKRFSESEESVMRVVEEKRVYICKG